MDFTCFANGREKVTPTHDYHALRGGRDRPSAPFRCLDPQYRRELVRVYLTNVEGICSRFMEEKRDELQALSARASDLRAFWAACTCARYFASLQSRAANPGRWSIAWDNDNRARLDDPHCIVRRGACSRTHFSWPC